MVLVRHLRSNLIAYLALFVALGGTSFAAAGGAPFIRGNGEVVSGSVRTPAFIETDPPGGTYPTILTVPSFGRFFVYSCVDAGPDVFFENTSSAPVRIAPVLGDGLVLPGETVAVPNPSPGDPLTVALANGTSFATAQRLAGAVILGDSEGEGLPCNARIQAMLTEE